MAPKQGQVIMGPDGAKRAEAADVAGLVLTGPIPGTRGDPAHDTTGAVCNSQTEAAW